jgi:hypothetical protein
VLLLSPCYAQTLIDALVMGFVTRPVASINASNEEKVKDATSLDAEANKTSNTDILFKPIGTVNISNSGLREP